MDKKNLWGLRMSAPKLYPIYVDWIYAKFGEEQAITCNASFVHDGIASILGTDSPEAPGYPLGVDIIWCSLLEKKWYMAEIDFSKTDLEWVKNLMAKGYEGYDNTSWEEKSIVRRPYDKFNVCCLPGGEIRIYFSGSRRTVCMDTVFRGEETHEMDDVIIHGTRSNRSESSQYWKDVSEFYDENLYEGKYQKSLEELKAMDSSFYEIIKNYREKRGVIPFGLWTDYYQRYDYKIHVAFENEKETVPQLENAYFSNGERYSRKMLVNPGSIILSPSPIRKMDIYWLVKDRYYFCNLFFNEEETFSIFKQAFDEHKGEEATLSVNVSKYNNYLEVYLKFRDSSYKFEKVEVNISTSVGFHGSKDYIYSNCDYSHKNEFVGF